LPSSGDELLEGIAVEIVDEGRVLLDPVGQPRRWHPTERQFTIRRILGGGDLWVSECVITYDGVPTYSLSVREVTDGLVTHETQYFANPFPAPPGRAVQAEPIPARGSEPGTAC
jgi:hypothetical protein